MVGEVDEDLAVLEEDGVGGEADGGVVVVLAGDAIELPGMPGADEAAVGEGAVAEGPVAMGAEAVERTDDAVVVIRPGGWRPGGGRERGRS
jgi:hypothetical protein